MAAGVAEIGSGPPREEEEEGGVTCGICKVKLDNQPDCIPFKFRFEDLNTKTSKGEENKSVHEFLCFMNSFLNGTGGSVLIHADKYPNLDYFDQKIDDKLLALIPDNAVYQDVYERYHLDDEHVLYRVKVRHGKRQLSVLAFHTKFSVSKGTTDPTHGQMNDFVEHIINSEPKDSRRFDIYRGSIGVLSEGENVMVTRELAHLPNPVHLTENICTQAKAFDKKEVTKECEYCWGKARPYISAFTKIPGGGSIYIGIKEEEIVIQQATSKPQAAGSKQSTKQATGKLQVEGFKLPIEIQTKMNTFFEEKVSEKLCWVAKEGHKKDVVRLYFKPVKKNDQPVKDKYVLEVKVDYCHGVCFVDPLGLELYRTIWKDNEIKGRIKIEEWLQRFKGHECLQVGADRRPEGAGAVGGKP